MSETWFRVWLSFHEIRPFQVEKFTDSSVWIGGRRNVRLTNHMSYFPTWDEAHTHLLQRTKADLDSARQRLQRAQGLYGNVKGMQRPVEVSA